MLSVLGNALVHYSVSGVIKRIVICLHYIIVYLAVRRSLDSNNECLEILCVLFGNGEYSQHIEGIVGIYSGLDEFCLGSRACRVLLGILDNVEVNVLDPDAYACDSKTALSDSLCVRLIQLDHKNAVLGNLGNAPLIGLNGGEDIPVSAVLYLYLVLSAVDYGVSDTDNAGFLYVCSADLYVIVPAVELCGLDVSLAGENSLLILYGDCAGRGLVAGLCSNGSRTSLNSGNNAVLDGSDRIVRGSPCNGLVGSVVGSYRSLESCRVADRELSGGLVERYLFNCDGLSLYGNLADCGNIAGSRGDLSRALANECNNAVAYGCDLFIGGLPYNYARAVLGGVLCGNVSL